MRVILVDDSPPVRQRLFELLTGSAGIEGVWQAAKAAEAIDLVRSQRIDLAVLDISLGPHSGLELIRELRHEHSEILLIVLTNSSSDAHRRECLRRGAHFFFDKSHEFERAVGLVTRLALTGQASP